MAFILLNLLQKAFLRTLLLFPPLKQNDWKRKKKKEKQEKNRYKGCCHSLFYVSEPEEKLKKKRTKRKSCHILKSEGNEENKWLYP